MAFVAVASTTRSTITDWPVDAAFKSREFPFEQNMCIARTGRRGANTATATATATVTPHYISTIVMHVEHVFGV